MAIKHNRWMTILSAILSALASLFSSFKLPVEDSSSSLDEEQSSSTDSPENATL